MKFMNKLVVSATLALASATAFEMVVTVAYLCSVIVSLTLATYKQYCKMVSLRHASQMAQWLLKLLLLA